MKKKQRKEREPLTLPVAVSRLIGTYAGALALTATYLVGVLCGVRAPTALLRGLVVWAIFVSLGRGLGWLAGKAVDQTLAASLRPQAETESVS